MFNWFSKTKLRYEKGQLAPIFIVILVILMIMAMVTINLSKVSLIKTDSANAVDSGALAGGSVMANIFNSVAKANSEMESAYWYFYASVSVSFVIAMYQLIRAATLACSKPCDAKGYIVSKMGFTKTTWSILIAVTGYWASQLYLYQQIRDMAEEGRENAIKIAHKFTFMNSGIGSKLKDGSPPLEIISAEQKRNYREEFTNFLNNLGSDNTYTYSWQDGDNRAHSASSRVSVDEVDKFDLKVTTLPFPAEVGLLSASLTLAYIAYGILETACKCSVTPKCRILCIPAVVLIVIDIGLIISAWAGLLPGGTATSSSGSDALPYTICWIDDIVHDRRFRVDTDQHHEGADLGLWETKYPDTHSYSIVDFRGDGQIHPPVLKHDASIVETDR